MPAEKCLIIGSGCAGLTAGIYAVRSNLNPLIIGGLIPGGQLMLTTEVENFPGFEKAVMGPDLMDLMRKQCERLGVRFLNDQIDRVDFRVKPFRVWTSGGKEISAHAVIVATGANAKWLGLHSEEKLRGKGVSACATCLPTGSPIVANSSPKTIESVKEGQKVLTHAGDFQTVQGKGKRLYKGKLIQFYSRYFREEPTLLTPEHPVLATRLFKGKGPNYWQWKWGAPAWVPAGDLGSDHILLYPIVSKIQDVKFIYLVDLLGLRLDEKNRVHYPYETHTARRIPNRIPLNSDFMRLAGYFLAEGTIAARGINFYFGSQESHYAQDVQSSIRRLFNYEARIKRENSVLRVECYAGILRDLFEKLFGKYSYGKSLPHWFMYLPKRKQAELIKGFWRGDGGRKKLGFVFVTNSVKWVTQLKIILLRLGVIPQIHRQSKERLNRSRNLLRGRRIYFRHDRYQLLVGGAWLQRACKILGEDHALLKTRRRTNSHGWIRGRFAYLPIADLKRIDYRGLVHNIAVARHNSYVTSGAAVHNCDGFFFKGKDLAVIGGGDTAMEEATFLTNFASSVTVVHRRDKLRASQAMQDKARKNSKIRFIWNSAVEEVLGEEMVAGLKLKNFKTQESSRLDCHGVFIAIGHEPATSFLKGALELDENGYIKTLPGSWVKTAVEGVFACGDCVDHRYRQAVTAAGMGCMSAMEANWWLQEQGFLV